MLLKSLRLKNFRQFVGEQKINFTYKKNENITIVLGKNTSGKTTLIKSFSWILYGKANFETEEILSIPVAEKMKPGDKEKVFGEIELIHRERDYIIRREQDYFMETSGEVIKENARFYIQHKTSDGQYKYLRTSDKVDTINNILPEDLADYFFFHGEEIKKIGENNRRGKKNITEAVESILGLEVIRSAIKHLSGGKKVSVIGKLKNSIDIQHDDKLKNKKNRLEKLEKKLSNLKRDIKDYEENINFYEKEIEEKNQELKKHKDTKKLKRKIDDNKLEIKEKKDKKTRKLNLIKNIISKNSFMFFMQPLINKAITKINNYDKFKEGIPEMRAKSIDYILENRDTCICGTEIKEGSEAYNNLKEYKKFLPPKSIGTVVRLFMNNSRHYKELGKDFYQNIKNSMAEVRELSQEIDELESQNAKYSEEIEKKPDIGNLETEINKLKRKLGQRRRKLRNKIEKKGNTKSEINRIEKDIKKLAQNSDKNKFIYHCLEYANYLNEKFEDHYKGLEKETRQKLEDRTNEIFNEIYHGNRSIKLKSNYDYYLESSEISDEYQQKADKSEGLKVVASFSFIAGIVSLAREKLFDDKETEEFETDPYPLVMDAPFSDTDEIHVKNISKVIPEVAEQTIMIIMEKDWKHASEVLERRVNKLFKMKKETETKTVIKER